MTKNNLITVVTDHQFAADTIAKAIGANEKHDGYYLGNGYAVTWTGGHVIEATFKPEESFVLSTDMDCRLVFAHNFEFTMRDFDELVGYKKSEHDKRQLETIKALWKKSDTIINAMIPDIEGDLAFLSLYYFFAIPKNVRRAWLPIMTKGAIVNAIIKGKIDTERYEKWLSDSIYNHLVKLTKSTKEKVGAFIVDEMSDDIAEKVENQYGIDMSHDSDACVVDNRLVIFTQHKSLYNLTGLLVDAATELDFTHEKTVQTAMMLYVKKLISYPFTQQNTIPYDVWKLMLTNKQVLAYNTKWGKKVKRYQKLSRRHNFRSGETIFNGHGIVTTGLHPTDLTRDEEKLYNMIVKRVLDAFTSVKSKRKKTSRKAKTA